MRRILLITLLAIGLAACAQTRSEAALRLRIEQGAIGVQIADQSAADGNPTVGVVQFSGAIGTFDINLTAGFSKPAIGGGLNYSEMDLLTFNGTTTGGSLQITLEDTDFPFIPQPDGPAVMVTRIGGTLSGAAGSFVNATSYVDPTNASIVSAAIVGPAPGLLPASAAIPGSAIQGMNQTFFPGAFAGTNVTGFTKNGNYSLFLQDNITIVGNGTVSFDHNLQVPVPEPTSIAIWALGAGVLGFVGYKRRKRVAV